MTPDGKRMWTIRGRMSVGEDHGSTDKDGGEATNDGENDVI